jgi:DNA-binding FadR family transcriptional regulator
MAANAPTLDGLIEAALAGHGGPVADATVQLWRRLAPELIGIIGELGFATLYARSIRLTRLRYAWIRQDSGLHSTFDFFQQLQQCLQAQDEAQARQASLLLFTHFLNTLASLIGEALAEHLLRSAWQRQASDTDGKQANDQ